MSKQLTWIPVLILAAGLAGCGSEGLSTSTSSKDSGNPAPASGVGGSSAVNNGSSGTAGSGASSSGGGSGTSGAAGSGSSSMGSGKGGSNASGGTAGTGATTPQPSGDANSAGEPGVSDPDDPNPPSVPGDQFEPVGTNPFVLTEYDPLSTFAVDADTASYDIFRRDVNAGNLPAPASVRLEEYVNNFAYHYPAPSEDSEDPFAIHLAAAPSLYDTGTLLVRVGIQGKQAPSERGPANLVFLVDVSGSMSEANKLPLVKVVLNEALDVLRPSDQIAIVTYAGSTSVALGPTPVSEKDTIKNVINGLGAGGSTAGASGMVLAYEQAALEFVEGGINHIVMCTDGDFNVGLSSDEEMLGLIREKRQTGITLTTLGFGSGNLNDQMMEKVSNAGNGMYSVISSEDQAISYANERLLSTMLHIAKDMKIQVEFNAEKVLAYRLLGYEDRAIADDQFRDDTVDAGEIGVGHRVTALYEVVPSGGAVPAPDGAPELLDGKEYSGEVEVDADDLVLVKVRYKQPGATESDPAKEVSSSLPESAAAASYRDLDVDFRWAVAVATFSEILKHSPYARLDQLETIDTIVTSDPDSASGAHGEFRTLFERARSMLTPK